MRDASRMQALVQRLASAVSAMLDAPVAGSYVPPSTADVEAAAAREEAASRDALRVELRRARVDLIAVLRTIEDLDEANALDDAAADGVTGARLHALAERVDDLSRRVEELAAQLIEGMG